MPLREPNKPIMEPNKKFNLNEMDKTLPFKVPENYFEDFAQKMQEQTVFAAPQQNVPLMVKLKPYLYMAASFIVIFSIALTVVYTHNDFANLVSSNKVDSSSTKVIAAKTTKNTNSATIKTNSEAEAQVSDEAYVDDLEADEYDLTYLDEFDDEI